MSLSISARRPAQSPGWHGGSEAFSTDHAMASCLHCFRASRAVRLAAMRISFSAVMKEDELCAAFVFARAERDKPPRAFARRRRDDAGIESAEFSGAA